MARVDRAHAYVFIRRFGGRPGKRNLGASCTSRPTAILLLELEHLLSKTVSKAIAFIHAVHPNQTPSMYFFHTYCNLTTLIHPPKTLTQYPGGLTRCDTLVHLGSSASLLANAHLSMALFQISLRMLFLYFFSFRSKMVYLSFGTISCSTGISSFHLSTGLVVKLYLDNALSSVATTESTARNRLRCRAF